MELEVIEKLKQRIQFDALLVGAGHRTSEGVVCISEILGQYNIDPNFIADYPDVAKEDVVGQLFAAYPRIIQIISVQEYRKLSNHSSLTKGTRAGKIIADYLEKYHIQHLMLAGVDSSFGLAWMTFYRHETSEPFSALDAEWAKYLVPAILFEWQQKTQQRQYLEMPTRLLPLTAREMQVSVLNLQGVLPKVIASQLSLSVYYVRDVIQSVRERLGIVGRKMTLDDLAKHQKG